VEDRLDHKRYIGILERFLERAPSLYTEEKRLQQDAAPPHRPKAVKDFLDDNYIKLHPHPPNSSDLNPIELIWPS